MRLRTWHAGPRTHRPIEARHTASRRRGLYPVTAATMRRLRRRIALVALAAAFQMGCSSNQVVRLRAGQTFEERTIDVRAYAAYLRGRIDEARGRTAQAVRQYETAVSLDPGASEAWVRLGAIHCLSAPGLCAGAWQKAEQLEPELPQLWLEKARCELKRNHSARAMQFAELAIRFEPSSTQAASEIAAAAVRLNRPQDALRWLLGATAMDPANVHLWEGLLVSSAWPRPMRQFAAGQLSKLRPMSESFIPPSDGRTIDELDPLRTAWYLHLEQELKSALRRGDTLAAQRIATSLRINPEQLVFLAFDEGSYKVVLDEVNLILGVDSDNASVWVTGLLAADRIGDNAQFAALLGHAPSSKTSIDDTLQSSLLDLISNRTTVDLRFLGGARTSVYPDRKFRREVPRGL